MLLYRITGCCCLALEELRSLPYDSICGAVRDTLAALDTFLIPDLSDIGFAVIYAESAVDALVVFDLYTEYRNSVKESVQSAERTYKTAEQTEDEDTSRNDRNHKQELPCEQRAEHTEVAFVDLVRKKSDSALKRSGGTYVLTERRQGSIAECVHYRYDKNEEYEYDVLKIRKDSRHLVLFQLGRFDLIHQILNKTEGTEPSAYHSAEEYRIEQKDAAYVIEGASVCAEASLKRAERAGSDRSRTGIAVDAGNTHFFGIALINITGNESLKISIEKQSAI